MTVIPRRNRPIPPRTEIVVDMRSYRPYRSRFFFELDTCGSEILFRLRVYLRVGKVQTLDRINDCGRDN
jgi:hypothetical protein